MEITEEMKKMASSAANAYVSGLKERDAKIAVDSFLEAYDYALKKIWLRSHKENAMKDIRSANFDDEEK